MPELSVGASLAWKYAARIALGKKQEQIDKEHLLIGICYLDKAVYHEKELQNLHLSTGARNGLLAEHHQLSGIFKQAGFLSVDLRHCLWDILPEGTYQHDGTVVHRNESCKQIFAEAENVAKMQGSSRISSIHLIAAICKDPGDRIKRTITDLGTDCRTLYHLALDSETLSKPSVVISDDYSDLLSHPKPQTTPPKAPGKTEWLTLLFGRDLTNDALEGTLEPCIGRRKEMLQIIQTLARSTRNNPLLIGEPGVGKTALVHALANRTAHEKDSHVLKGKRIIQLDIGALIRQTSQKKSIEKLFSRIIKEVRSKPEWIIFIDRIHQFIGTAHAKGAVSQVTNLIKPAIERGDLQCIGATTFSGYKHFIEPDSSIKRRFATIIVNEPTRDEALEILGCLKSNWEVHHGVTITDKALEAAVDLSVQFDKKCKLPEKAIDLIDKACAHTRIPNLSLILDEDLDEYAREDRLAVPVVTEEIVAQVLAENAGMPHKTVIQYYRRRPDRDRHVNRTIEKAVKQYSQRLPEAISPDDMFRHYPALLGQSSQIKKVFQRIVKVASTNEPVLIVGETGTGKELVAGALQHLSQRPDGPFIILNSAAIPEELIESELFGHEKGAFTGASAAKKGKFELADGGTLFLDEIGDMSLKTQARILRIIQEQTFERVGGDRVRKVDVRLLAATHKNLQKLIKDELFREDLFYRLNVYPIILPPLRERIEDIPVLALHFILQKQMENAAIKVKRISPDAISFIMRYPWPGNIRQLRNVIGAVMVDLTGENKDTIERADLEKILRSLEKHYMKNGTESDEYFGFSGLDRAEEQDTGALPLQRSQVERRFNVNDEVRRWLERFEQGETLADHKIIFQSYGKREGMIVYTALFEEGKNRFRTCKNFIEKIGLLDQHAAIRNKLLLFRRELQKEDL